MVRTRQPSIDRAMVHIDDERDLIRTERDAFETFLDRLRDIQTDIYEPSGMERSPTVLTAASSPAPTELQEIRQAYRNIIMSVSHYDREYGDTLRESLEAEVGQALAVQIVSGHTLTPTVHSYLIEATKKARDDRTKFLAQIHRERESLASIAGELNEIERRAVELDERIETTQKSSRLSEIDETLNTLKERCSSLAARRQEQVHNRGNHDFSGLDAVSLSQYLYADMGTVTPAMADIASCLETIQYKRTRCLR